MVVQRLFNEFSMTFTGVQWFPSFSLSPVRLSGLPGTSCPTFCFSSSQAGTSVAKSMSAALYMPQRSSKQKTTKRLTTASLKYLPGAFSKSHSTYMYRYMHVSF